MSRQAKQFSELFKAGKEALQETVKENLSLSKILGDIGTELKDQAAHGAHELAAALFRGTDAFVMYPRTNHDKAPEHGLPQETPQQEQDRGGREM
jgi:hypothetical protein